ncbi:MAG: MBL fold metallo-hydrolase [Nitrospira sp.]|nr:MBL fold metallo-hydrolase [Nitrospira sp.]
MPQRVTHAVMMRRGTIIAGVMVCLGLAGCYERMVEPADVFGDVHQGETYSPASHMIDDWYAVEAIDRQTFAINEPHSSQYNTSYLIVGDTRAVMFDAGSGERPAGSRSMRDVAERYAGNRPMTLILSHFHYDHIADAATFDGVTLLDRPDIRANITDQVFTITPWESLDTEWRSLKVTALISDGEVIDLGGRSLTVFNVPGHATESLVLLDRSRNQVFTGDFVYRHLGGIIAFALGSDLLAYKANSARLLQLTNIDTQFFGAHGIPQFGRDWLMLLDRELDTMVTGKATYRYVAHYLAPGLPWRVQRNGDLSIYTTPLVDPHLFWSTWTLLLLVVVSILALYLLLRIVRWSFGRGCVDCSGV